ncbi:MAG TPA: energy transducer TonB [Candidatus Sulfotelmatobacter sp.]|jgi:hypothetical protein|nr:energy transducer TonB [Candidatus Sulfotelmatobacter sp.]
MFLYLVPLLPHDIDCSGVERCLDILYRCATSGRWAQHERGAIGYVPGDASIEGVKVVVVSDGHSAERRLLTRVEPEYPETLQQLQIGGTVRLAVTISPRGTVEKVALLGGNPILAEAASKSGEAMALYAGAIPDHN